MPVGLGYWCAWLRRDLVISQVMPLATLLSTADPGIPRWTSKSHVTHVKLPTIIVKGVTRNGCSTPVSIP
jgi:hypothetical protein